VPYVLRGVHPPAGRVKKPQGASTPSTPLRRPPWWVFVRETEMRSQRVCELDGCEEVFTPPHRAPNKRFCSERHQRTDEKRRYRQRHVEQATCRGCGKPFERSSTDGHLRLYCSTRCQYRHRSVTYATRPDIRDNLARARLFRGGGVAGDPDAGIAETAGVAVSGYVRLHKDGYSPGWKSVGGGGPL